MTPTITLTPSAIAKIADLIKKEDDPVMLRVYVQGGGCSGFQYGFTFDEKIEDGDSVIEEDGVTVLVDCMSIQYLAGASVDFVEELMGSKFVIKNPNANTSCGCGESFS